MSFSLRRCWSNGWILSLPRFCCRDRSLEFLAFFRAFWHRSLVSYGVFLCVGRGVSPISPPCFHLGNAFLLEWRQCVFTTSSFNYSVQGFPSCRREPTSCPHFSFRSVVPPNHTQFVYRKPNQTSRLVPILPRETDFLVILPRYPFSIRPSITYLGRAMGNYLRTVVKGVL